jgi:predicted lipase
MARHSFFLLACATTAAGFDETLALKRAHQSGAAYCPAQQVAAWACKPCVASGSVLSHVTYIQNASSQLAGFVGLDRTADEIIVAFRGSETAENWLDDFDVTLTPFGCSNCSVHEGWLRDYRSIRAQLHASVSALLDVSPSATVAFSGHSLGAALSELAAYDFAVSTFAPIINIYTFGAPRTGNPSWAAGWAEAVLTSVDRFRVVHWLDPVPHLPPTFFDYGHAPTEVWYNTENGTSAFVVCSATNGEDPACSDSIFPDRPKDHSYYLGIELGEDAC